MVVINETTLGLVFAIVGVISTIIYYGFLGAGLKSLRNISDSVSSEEAEQDPLDVLRDRYARGELSDEEFERKTEQLIGTETREKIREKEY
jgi:uncharacterized membrane protein